jgi:hypothetical protein
MCLDWELGARIQELGGDLWAVDTLVGRGSRETEHHYQGLGRFAAFTYGRAQTRAEPLCVPPFWGDYVTDLRLGTSIDLILLNGVDALWTLLLFWVFREPRPTKIGAPRHTLLAPRF